MRIPTLILVELSLLLLGAHAFRTWSIGLAFSITGLALLTFSRLAWTRPVILAALALGCGVWLDTALNLVRIRMAMNLPWTRLAIIMGSVGAMTFIAFTLLLSRFGRDWFNRGKENAWFGSALFIITAVILTIAKTKVSFPILLADRYFPGWGHLEIFFLATYAVFIGHMMLDPKQAKAVRPRIWALFSLIFFLQLGLGLVGMENMLMTGKLHLPVPALIAAGPIFRGGGLFMIILFSATILLVGPAWCSHLCYIGAWDDASSRISGKKPMTTLPGRKHWGRLITLVLVIGAALILRWLQVPGTTAIWLAVAFGLGGVWIMLTISRRNGLMVHCTTYCPMGILGNFFGKIAPWRIRMNSNCTKCGICSKSCRYGALQIFDIERSTPGITCTLCGDCFGACPHDALEYRFPGLAPNTARMLFLVIVIGLHATFLGVARI